MKIIFTILFLVLVGLNSCKNMEVGNRDWISHSIEYQDSSFRAVCELKRGNLFSDEPNSFKITVKNISDRNIYTTKNINEQPYLNGYSIQCGDSVLKNSGLELIKMGAGESVVYNIPNQFEVFKKGKEFSDNELLVNFFYMPEYKEIISAGTGSNVASEENSQSKILKSEFKFKKK